MNQWSLRRKRVIFILVLLVFVLLIGLPLFFLFYKSPTCFDGKQNGSEAGIDCGGSCRLLCTSDSLPLISRGDPRVLTVAEGVYEVVALVENPNTVGVVDRAGYTIKLYNKESSNPIRVLEGVTYVPKGKMFAVFKGPFNLDIVPTRATLEWSDGLDWSVDTEPLLQLEVNEVILSWEDTNPRVEGVLRNTSLERVFNVDLTVLISNSEGNIFAASKTFVESLSGGEERQIVFTWPRPFLERASSTQIIVQVLPDQSLIR